MQKEDLTARGLPVSQNRTDLLMAVAGTLPGLKPAPALQADCPLPAIGAAVAAAQARCWQPVLSVAAAAALELDAWPLAAQAGAC